MSDDRDGAPAAPSDDDYRLWTPRDTAVLGLRRRHVAVLQRRLDFLEACESTGRTNDYERAEASALAAALAELRSLLAARSAEVTADVCVAEKMKL